MAEQIACQSQPLGVDAQALCDVECLVWHLAVLHLDQTIVHLPVLEAFDSEATCMARLDVIVCGHDQADRAV